MSRKLVLSPMILGMLFCSACADPHQGREEVSGTVSVRGQLIREGVIGFEPLDGQGTQSGAVITEGRFTVPQRSGLRPGRYRVRISAGESNVARDLDTPPGPTRGVVKELVPAAWNLRSNKIVNITDGGSNTFEFDVDD